MSDNGLVVYNTLTGKKEVFTPIKENKVSMYVCGPTTYNFIHLGNARPLVAFDTVRRYLEYRGYEVEFIQNFTDVDDKIIKRSQEEKISPNELAANYIREYYEDADALGVKRATVHPKVSEHMQEIIDFVKALQEKNFAYEVEGDVYFDVQSFADYGKLSGRSLDDMQAGARVEVDARKKDPADFALWKKAKEGEPNWTSPWGQGRPGWHIECSAMSYKYLGATFDIHAGGCDLIFPHHENEIAQSEALFGTTMAKYWLHNGFITVNHEKMSKSLGNFFLVRDILKKFPGPIIRFYLLATHYRSQLDFDDEKLDSAQKAFERLRTTKRLLEEALDKKESSANIAWDQTAVNFSVELTQMRERFIEAMDDDFNTALAIGVLFDVARSINVFVAAGRSGSRSGEELQQAAELFRELCTVLGLDLDQQNTVAVSLDGKLMGLILDIREEARLKKDFITADKIRDSLKSMGIIIEDTAQGARWRNQ